MYDGSLIEIEKNAFNMLRRKVANALVLGDADAFSDEKKAAFKQELFDLASPEDQAILTEQQKILDNLDPKTKKIDLVSPPSSLFWGIELASTYNREGGNIIHTPIWKAITNNPAMTRELRSTLYQIQSTVGNQNVNVRFSAGKAPTFCFIPDKNVIQFDAVWGLIDGLENVTAALMHEVGHSKLTLKSAWNPVSDISTQMQTIKDNVVQQNRRMTEAEYRQLATLAVKAQVVNSLLQESENNVVNRFAVNQTRHSTMDIGYALNMTENLFVDLNRTKQVVSPQERLMNLSQMMRYAFFRNNRFFEDMPEWEKKLSLDPSQIRALDKDGKTLMSPADSVVLLQKLCKQFENAQPSNLNRILGNFDKIAQKKQEERNRVLTEIVDRFAQPIIDDMVKERQQEIDQSKQQSGNSGQGQSGQSQQQGGQGGQSGQDQQQSGQGGQSGQDQQQGGQGGQSGQDQQQGGQGGQSGQSQQQSGQGGQSGQDQQQGGQGGQSGQSQQQSGQGGQSGQDQQQGGQGGQSGQDQQQGGQGGQSGQDQQQGGQGGQSGQDQQQGGQGGQSGQDQQQGGQGGQSGQDQQQGGQSGQSGQDGKDDQGKEQGGSAGGQNGQDGKDDQGKEQGGSAGGQNGQDGKDDQGKEQGGQGSQDAKNDQGQNGQGQDGKTQESQGHGDKGSQQGQQSSGQGQDGQAQEGQGQNIPKKIEVDGLGEMTDIEVPTNEFDKEAQKKENAAHEDTGRSIEDLNRQIREDEMSGGDNGSSGNGQNGGGDQSQSAFTQSQSGGQGGGGRGIGMSLSDPYNHGPESHLSQRSLDRYQRIIADNLSQVRQVEVFLRRFKEKQFKLSNEISKKHEILPEDSISERLNSSYLRDLIVRQKAGLDISREDRKVFRANAEQKKTPVPIDIVIGIDASGSMEGSTMRDAVTAACVLYEAARRNDMNVFIDLLYDSGCVELANPETPHSEIASEIASIRPSGGSSFMHNGLLRMLEQIGSQKKLKKDELVGDSHVFILTDGGFYGENRMVSQFVKDIPSVTLDFCIIGSDDSPIEDLIQSGERRVGKVNVEDSSEVAEKLTTLLRKRLNQKTLDAQTYRKKKHQIDRFNKGYQ